MYSFINKSTQSSLFVCYFVKAFLFLIYKIPQIEFGLTTRHSKISPVIAVDFSYNSGDEHAETCKLERYIIGLFKVGLHSKIFAGAKKSA